jgi:DNA processing protein
VPGIRRSPKATVSQYALLDPRDPSPDVRARLCDWLALQAVGALRPARARSALQAQGGCPRAAARALADAFPAELVPGADELERRIATLARCGVVGLPLGSPDYPLRLARLDDPAPLLLVRGDPSALRAPSVAVVGARACTGSGREAAGRLGADLAGLGFSVVSGLARGIDAAAHRGALSVGGISVGVLACGPDVLYPPEHAELREALCQRGAVVSELPPGAEPLRYHFPLRNRLIAGLAKALVVVEARERSGSLISVGHAREQGLTVLAVPGPVDSPVCRGSNLLLRDGVRVCLDVDDVLKALELPPPAYVRKDPLAGIESPGQRGLLRALLDEPSTPDQLARRLGRSPGELAADLVQLELGGRVIRGRDGRLRAHRAPGLS